MQQHGAIHLALTAAQSSLEAAVRRVTPVAYWSSCKNTTTTLVLSSVPRSSASMSSRFAIMSAVRAHGAQRTTREASCSARGVEMGACAPRPARGSDVCCDV